MTPAENEKHDHFLRLYVKHEEALNGFVRTLVPTREDAREVMQEVAVVLWRKFEELGRVHEFLAIRKAETRQTAAKKVFASLS